MTEAKDLLERILSEVNAADTEMFQPNTPIRSSNETVIGVCEDPLTRKLWAVAQFYRREAGHANVDCKINGNNIKYDPTFNRADDMGDVLHGLFWLLLREQLNLFDKGGIGIRKEWKVVKLKDDDEYNCEGGHGPSSGVHVVDASGLPDALKKLLRGLSD